jgi:hypothetical protein
MACALTQGYSITDCKGGAGGVREVYLMELGNMSSYTETAGVITDITKASGKRFWKYEQIKETSYGKETPNGNEQNQTIFYQQEVGVILNKMQSATRNEILLIAQNLLVVVIKDNNDKFWMYGQVNGLSLTGGEFGTGTAMGDRNGYSLVFTGMETSPAIEVDSTTAAALETPGT